MSGTGGSPFQLLRQLQELRGPLSGELRHRLSHWFSQVELVVVGSAHDALMQLEKTTPRLLLLDLQISDMKALEFVKKVRGAKFADPEAIIALSQSAGTKEFEALRKLEVRTILSRGKMLAPMLEPILRNVFAATHQPA